ncbi:uncharacterized protein BYT42DRAFT_542723 [Radiomyces spectabilis]|uniref:uncharacterized protein n=1 Tax=Radiomyces spectabilis TaxID=64574 RepID=UPI0022202F72|nr:uncharacterized protein BYT42DRAFT_542723 [Radiomyces spectabilis]KAI8391109.1 hypothetical protein BYT42DRAFT_542723 [Radiomyces spectabilis]
MHRSRGRSISQIQDDEVFQIDAQMEYINRFMKWNIGDLDRFATLLKARLTAEEAYVQSLQKITKSVTVPEPEPATYFGEINGTFQHAVFQYELSVQRIVDLKRDLIHSLKTQLNQVFEVKVEVGNVSADDLMHQELQDNRRRKTKGYISEKNMDYANFRTKDIVKLHKNYENRCHEYQAAQQQLQQQQHQQQQSGQPLSAGDHYADHYMPPTRLSVDEPQPRLSSESGRDADASSIHSTSNNSHDNAHKKALVGFMAQVRTQFANVAAAAAAANNNMPMDISKQNVKLSKMKKDIADADLEYREGIRELERRRKRQIEAINVAMKQIEIVLTDKAKMTRSVLGGILTAERTVLCEEIAVLDYSLRITEAVDSKKDIMSFFAEYNRKRKAVTPSPIFYENFFYGRCKHIVFGVSLQEYAAEYERSVPIVVTKCIEAIERMGGLQKEGIYRIPGRQSNIEMLKTLFEQNEDIQDLETKYDVFTIATVLKIYLRELPQPLFDLSVQDRMKYSRTYCILTETSSRYFAVPYSSSCQMNLQNLSVIFTPAIFHDHNQAEHPGEWQTDSVFEDLINYEDIVFANPDSQRPSVNTIQQQMQGIPSSASPSSETRNRISSHHGTPTNLLLTAPMQPPLIPVAGVSEGSRVQPPQSQRSASLAQPSHFNNATTTLNDHTIDSGQSYPSIGKQYTPELAQEHYTYQPINDMYNTDMSTLFSSSKTLDETPEDEKTFLPPSTPSEEAPSIKTALSSTPFLARKSSLHAKASGTVPPRQDSLRQKMALANRPATTIACSRSGPQPSKPQLPIIATVTGIHTPSSAEISPNYDYIESQAAKEKLPTNDKPS